MNLVELNTRYNFNVFVLLIGFNFNFKSNAIFRC